MKNFDILEKEELLETEGGSIGALLGGVVSVVTIYAGIREIAKDAGRAAGYRELEKQKK